jgi:hypothetical protein
MGVMVQQIVFQVLLFITQEVEVDHQEIMEHQVLQLQED